MTVVRAPLREQVKNVLVQRILDGVYEPGDRLVETAIARELGTSQAPVREALRELEQLRLVESEHHRGARVRAVSLEELAEVYPVRGALEELAARTAAVALRGDVRALEEELAAMDAAAAEADFHELVRHDAAFHRLIVEAAANDTLLAVWGSLNIESRTLVTALSTRIDPAALADLHRPLLEALRRGDPDAAGTEARRHLERLRDLFLEGGHK